MADYPVEIMRRRWADVINMGMDYIPDAAELSLLVVGWLPTIAEVHGLGGLVGCFWPLVCRSYVGISMLEAFGGRQKIFHNLLFVV